MNKNIKLGNEPIKTFSFLYMNFLRLAKPLSYSSPFLQGKQTDNVTGKLII